MEEREEGWTSIDASIHLLDDKMEMTWYSQTKEDSTPPTHFQLTK